MQEGDKKYKVLDHGLFHGHNKMISFIACRNLSYDFDVEILLFLDDVYIYSHEEIEILESTDEWPRKVSFSNENGHPYCTLRWKGTFDCQIILSDGAIYLEDAQSILHLFCSLVGDYKDMYAREMDKKSKSD